MVRTVPPGERRQWLAANDLTITLFIAPQVLPALLQICWVILTSAYVHAMKLPKQQTEVALHRRC